MRMLRPRSGRGDFLLLGAYLRHTSPPGAIFGARFWPQTNYGPRDLFWPPTLRSWKNQFPLYSTCIWPTPSCALVPTISTPCNDFTETFQRGPRGRHGLRSDAVGRNDFTRRAVTRRAPCASMADSSQRSVAGSSLRSVRNSQRSAAPAPSVPRSDRRTRVSSAERRTRVSSAAPNASSSVRLRQLVALAASLCSRYKRWISVLRQRRWVGFLWILLISWTYFAFICTVKKDALDPWTCFTGQCQDRQVIRNRDFYLRDALNWWPPMAGLLPIMLTQCGLISLRIPAGGEGTRRAGLLEALPWALAGTFGEAQQLTELTLFWSDASNAPAFIVEVIINSVSAAASIIGFFIFQKLRITLRYREQHNVEAYLRKFDRRANYALIGQVMCFVYAILTAFVTTTMTKDIISAEGASYLACQTYNLSRVNEACYWADMSGSAERQTCADDEAFGADCETPLHSHSQSYEKNLTARPRRRASMQI